MIENVKYKFGRFFLKRFEGDTQGKRKALNFDEIKSVCILSAIASEQEWKALIEIREKIRKDWGIIDVKAIAYNSSRKPPKWMNQSSGISIFTKKDTNFYGKPKHLSDTKNFDLLIDFSNTRCVPILFHVKSIQAKLKFAKQWAHNKNYFDMFIIVADNKESTYFFNRIEHYLKIINKR